MRLEKQEPEGYWAEKRGWILKTDVDREQTQKWGNGSGTGLEPGTTCITKVIGMYICKRWIAQLKNGKSEYRISAKDV